MDLAGITTSQRTYFQTGATRPHSFRLAQLQRLRQMLCEHEDEIFEALRRDLGKPVLETYVSEIGFVLAEIDHAIRHLGAWMRPQRVRSPLTLFPASSRITHEPRGRVLIIAPWNYPLQLLVGPLVGAIAAGNCAVLKPSELAPATAELAARLIEKTFDPAYVAVLQGGPEISQALIAERFDYLFFTGGTAVGRIVAQAAAKALTPMTLELGGKSPCIVCADADLPLAARRIAWGKFLNAGQTCVAPDYLLVHQSVAPAFTQALRQAIHAFYGDSPASSPDFGRIINEQHFDRLVALLEEGEVTVGGQHDRATRYIAPTVITGVSPASKIMQTEIFGPLLPILTFETLNEAMAIIQTMPDPLALYLFSRDGATQRKVMEDLRFGGGCVNDTVLYYANTNLPFGGIGESGMGAYHGRHSFETFSHKKAVLQGATWLDLPIRYPAYQKWKLRLLRWLMG